MKTKQFNLEEALNGAKVVTRDGRRVKQLTMFNTIDKMKLYGVIDEEVYCWRENGKYNAETVVTDGDLFIAVETKSAWVNVYIDENKIWLGHTYPSKEEAIEKITNRCTYIKTIQITDEL